MTSLIGYSGWDGDRIYDACMDARVNVCQTDYCPRCHCDAGGDGCANCRLIRDRGPVVCAGCGIPMPANGRLRECRGERGDREVA